MYLQIVIIFIALFCSFDNLFHSNPQESIANGKKDKTKYMHIYIYIYKVSWLNKTSYVSACSSPPAWNIYYWIFFKNNNSSSWILLLLAHTKSCAIYKNRVNVTHCWPSVRQTVWQFFKEPIIMAWILKRPIKILSFRACLGAASI